MSNVGDETSVQVAIRVRPQNARELIDMCCVCTSCTPDQPQIVLGKDKAFTYDYVFDINAEQIAIYESCIEPLVKGCFDGYNATVLAYGQTGSGKTFTMGTGFDFNILPEQQGMIPRAVAQIFAIIDEKKAEAKEKGEGVPMFEVTAEFLELYNEEIIDLFDANRDASRRLKIHEDNNGSIYVAGTTSQRVQSATETSECLRTGALSRTVASTNMNAQSSRSHAIFTLTILQRRPIGDEKGEGSEQDWESLSAKFHFVDLAGSERLKRTGATGDRAKEGISINCGLLALGNVISALGDMTKKSSHVPYRDSKLTRLLQDSLGGNSRTLMIACVSPTDRDFMETLNTLKYANRARNIKNKVAVNQDKTSQQLAALRARIQELELELQEFKSGRVVVSETGSVVMNDMATEITMLRTENDKLRLRVKAMQQTIDSQSERLAVLQAIQKAASISHDESTGQVLDARVEQGGVASAIQEYIKQIEELKSKLVLSETMSEQNPKSPYRRMVGHHMPTAPSSLGVVMKTEDLLEAAKSNIHKLRGKEDKSERKISRKHSSGQSVVPTEGSGDTAGSTHTLEPSETDEETESSFEDVTSEEEVLHSMSSSEDDEDTVSLASSVAELSQEINLKQQLVDQLEKTQKNLQSIKQQYEDKMQVLQQQIKNIEVERDKMLKEIANRREERNEEKAKEVRARYERELSSLKVELKTLKSAKKEHAKALKMNAQQENELNRLKADLLEMKKQRVKMLNQMRTEATTKKLEDQRKSKEIAQLKKDSQKKECRIKSLEAEAKKKEFVLKRRQEELAALRKNKLRTAASAGSLPIESGATFALPAKDEVSRVTFALPAKDEVSPSSTMVRRKSSVFTSEGAKRKWRDLERKVLGTIMRRKTVNVMSLDMDHWIEKRGQLSKQLDELKGQRARLMEEDKVDSDEVTSVDEDLDSVTANIEYVQQNILELQNELIAVEDARTVEGDTVEAHGIIMSCNPRECKYIMEHLLDLILHLGVTAQQKEADVKALEARLKASEHSVEVISSLSTPHQPPLSASRTITKAPSHHSALHDLPPPPPLVLHDESTSSEDGKHSDSSIEVAQSRPRSSSQGSKPTSPVKVVDSTKVSKGTDHTDNETVRADRGGGVDTKFRRRTALPADILSASRRHTSLLARMGKSLIADLDEGEVDQSDGRSTDGESSGSVVDACRGGGATVPASRRTMKERSKSVEILGTSPPSSAVSRSERSLQESRRSGSGRLLTCVHTASGHTAAVTSVYADQNLLFSASQDRTVKVWDLKTSTELLTLEKHLSYVRNVKYCPHTRLIFTASQNIIKIWDMRNHKAQCVKTFGSPTGSSDAVQDLLVFREGESLFSASGNIVNIWDVQKMVHVGKLTGHNGGVSALAVLNNLLITGSRDRLIKLYNLDAVQFESGPPAGVAMAAYPPQHTLQPPHYDAVTSFAVHSMYLYSACGVTIKQWDVRLQCLKQAVDGAHPQGSVIHSLGIFPASTPLLVSGCKGGLVKLWNTESCTYIGEVQAHKGSISTIATNDSFIFSGSSDKTIRIWKLGPLPDS